MSELIVRMEMPKVCITKDGYYGNCPMDRVWCVQRNAPSGIKMGDVYAEMTDNIPSWCPIKGELPDNHGDLKDADEILEIVRGRAYLLATQPNSTDYSWEVAVVEQVVAEAKTVIAAERKDNSNG